MEPAPIYDDAGKTSEPLEQARGGTGAVGSYYSSRINVHCAFRVYARFDRRGKRVSFNNSWAILLPLARKGGKWPLL
jgi:hypothetical protein